MQTKYKAPLSLLGDRPLPSWIRLYLEFNHLKQLYRQGWLLRQVPRERCESVAEHSFAVALLSLFLADELAPHLDQNRLLQLALLHDLGEVYAGDLTPHDEIPPQQKEQMEREAIRHIVAQLPSGIRYLQLWEEYNAQQTEEARFVKDIDLLEMLLQAFVYEVEEVATLQEFFDHVPPRLQHPTLQQLLPQLLTLRQQLFLPRPPFCWPSASLSWGE